MKNHDSNRFRYGHKYTVGLVAEMFKEFTIVALNEEQAEQIAIRKARNSTKTLQNMGYNIGDIDTVEVKKKKIGFKK